MTAQIIDFERHRLARNYARIAAERGTVVRHTEDGRAYVQLGEGVFLGAPPAGLIFPGRARFIGDEAGC